VQHVRTGGSKRALLGTTVVVVNNRLPSTQCSKLPAVIRQCRYARFRQCEADYSIVHGRQPIPEYRGTSDVVIQFREIFLDRCPKELSIYTCIYKDSPTFEGTVVISRFSCIVSFQAPSEPLMRVAPVPIPIENLQISFPGYFDPHLQYHTRLAVHIFRPCVSPPEALLQSSAFPTPKFQTTSSPSSA